MRCRVWECTSWLSPLGATGWTVAFPLLPKLGTVSQEKLEVYLDLLRAGRRCHLLRRLHTMSFSCRRRSPAGTTLAILGQILRAVIAAILSSRFCERTVRTSAGQGSPRREGLALGSESPLKAKDAARLFRPVGPDPGGTATLPTALGTTHAGEIKSRWLKAWGQGSVILRTARGVM